MASSMEFGLLGRLVVRCDGLEVPVRRGGQRAVLAALLLQANRLVTLDAIIETLWGHEPPVSALLTIRNYVSRLRREMGEAGRERIATQPRGYLIHVGDGELDLARFEHLLADARAATGGGSWERAAARARAALELWRGEPLADIESDTLALREVPRLAELRLQATELRIDADLRLGRHFEVVAELQHLAAAQPLREHAHALLMLALHRSGRQADALAAYRHVRTLLTEELGAEPGSELRQLHQQVLAAGPTLHGARPGRPDGPAPAVPRQLPPAVARFTGRAGELAALTRMLGQPGDDVPGTVVISAIGGMAGVGKTALALHWAHQVADRFPGGQLYADLRGFDPSGTPAASAETIHAFLGALGVPPERIPPGPNAQQGLYRSLLADRRMLIVLDNARDDQQVRPLLPAAPGTLVLVTSRRQLTGLAAADNASLLSLDVLPHAEARELLAARLGPDRTAAEPEALAEIAALCAYLPLALAVAAARAAARPGFPLAALAAELRDASGRLDALDVGGPAVRAVFSWSARQLTGEAARMFRLLGLHPGPEITVPAAASLAACDHAPARRVLGELSRAHLVAEHTPGRYACHDLLRAYAAELAIATDDHADRHEAIGRLLDHYLHTGYNAAVLLDPPKVPVTPAPPRPGVIPEQIAACPQALAWFEAEHQVLLAAAALAGTESDERAWQIPAIMSDFCDRHAHWYEQSRIQRAALAAAMRLGDAVAQATMRRLLATATGKLAEYEDAGVHLAACLDLYQQLGDRDGEARAQMALSWLAERKGRHADALDHSEQALRLFRAIGDRAGQARSLNNVGWCHTQLGDYEQARSFCRHALALNREAGDRQSVANAWHSLGYAEQCLGRPAEAAECYRDAIRIYRELGGRYDEAETLTRLGDIHCAAGELPRAREAWRQALAILDDLNHPGADQVRGKLATAAGPGPPEAAGSSPFISRGPAGSAVRTA